MSWLTDITSKAESFLNQIDQSAAQTLQNTEGQKQHIGEINIKPKYVKMKFSPPITPINANTTFNCFDYKHPAAANVNRSAEAKMPSLSKQSHSLVQTNLSRSSSTPSLKKEDEKLFEFLNSTNTTEPTTTKGHVPNLSGPKTSTPRKTLPILSKSSSSEHIPVSQPQEQKQNVDVIDSVPKEDIKKSDDDILPVNQYSNVDATHISKMNKRIADDKKISDDRISNLELENKLLKNEMRSLNEELAATLNNLKEQQEESAKYRMRYENRRTRQNDDYERLRSEYESKEQDLNEALKAKDSQLAVLRVRIQDVDAELKGKTEMLSQIQDQNEQIMKDHTDASGVNSVALDSLRIKFEEVEYKLQKERNENSSIKTELMNLQTKLQSEQQQYVNAIKLLESKQNEGKDKFREYKTKVKNAEDMAVNARQELQGYKEKAARILQAKERLIGSLKQGSGSADVSPMLLTELESVKQERDMLHEEFQQNKYNGEQLRSEFLDLELLHSTMVDENHEKIENLQTSLQNENQKRQHAEEDMKRYMQELQFTCDDLHKVKKNQIMQNQQYGTEVKRLQQQIAVKQNVSSTQEELENRIHTLTDSLIQKQTIVETLGTEKNSLVLQLERLEKQYHDVQSSLIRRNKENDQHDVEDPDGARLQPMASIMPTQITHNKHWKTTVNEIDKFSVRLGVFLRRYPAARLMVIIYMLILHFWVTFVLLTYTPEIHSDDPM